MWLIEIAVMGLALATFAVLGAAFRELFLIQEDEACECDGPCWFPRP